MRVKRHSDDDRFFDIQEISIEEASSLAIALKMAQEQCDRDKREGYGHNPTRDGIQRLIDELKPDLNRSMKQDPERDEEDEWDSDYPFC